MTAEAEMEREGEETITRAITLTSPVDSYDLTTNDDNLITGRLSSFKELQLIMAQLIERTHPTTGMCRGRSGGTRYGHAAR